MPDERKSIKEIFSTYKEPKIKEFMALAKEPPATMLNKSCIIKYEFIFSPYILLNSNPLKFILKFLNIYWAKKNKYYKIYYNTTSKLHKFIYIILQYYTMNDDEKTIVTSIRISKEVLKEAKKQSLERGLKLGKFIESAILHELQR